MLKRAPKLVSSRLGILPLRVSQAAAVRITVINQTISYRYANAVAAAFATAGR
jgi:hypothetical protein